MDYNGANPYWREIWQQFEACLNISRPQPSLGWSPYKERWQPIYNSLRTEFRLAAPLPEGEEE